MKMKYQRTCRVWSLLAYAASKSHILIDEEVKALIGISERGLMKYLWLISKYCEQKGYPFLNTIVVNKKTGLPEDEVELPQGTTIDQAQIAVKLYGGNWLRTVAPDPADFEKLDR